jgi:hypothetical protein
LVPSCCEQRRGRRYSIYAAARLSFQNFEQSCHLSPGTPLQSTGAFSCTARPGYSRAVKWSGENGPRNTGNTSNMVAATAFGGHPHPTPVFSLNSLANFAGHSTFRWRRARGTRRRGQALRWPSRYRTGHRQSSRSLPRCRAQTDDGNDNHCIASTYRFTTTSLWNRWCRPDGSRMAEFARLGTAKAE